MFWFSMGFVLFAIVCCLNWDFFVVLHSLFSFWDFFVFVLHSLFSCCMSLGICGFEFLFNQASLENPRNL